MGIQVVSEICHRGNVRAERFVPFMVCVQSGTWVEEMLYLYILLQYHRTSVPSLGRWTLHGMLASGFSLLMLLFLSPVFIFPSQRRKSHASRVRQRGRPLRFSASKHLVVGQDMGRAGLRGFCLIDNWLEGG